LLHVQLQVVREGLSGDLPKVSDVVFLLIVNVA
jgi:hypothetical protein